MERILYLACMLYCMCIVSAHDPFEGFLQQSPTGCFKIVDVPAVCDANLADSFQPKSPKVGINKPETLAFLFSANSRDAPEPLHICGGRLPPGSTYDPEADTEIIIHGWLDGVCRTGWMREMKEQYFHRGRYNVILVDWTWGNFDYYHAGANCKIVGEQVGFIINNIMEQTGVGPEKFHIIGHSLGAISGGFVGRSVKNLRRITGLDPAYAPVGDAPPEERLTYRDAQIVDIIHSNGFQCFAEGVGDERPLGHVDFYPNGGKFQSSCYTYLVENLFKADLFYAIASFDPRLCNHLQSVQFYKLSINPKGCQYVGLAYDSYESFKKKSSTCGDWAFMGYDYEQTHKSGRLQQKFFLDTTIFCPYYDYSYLEGKQLPFNISCDYLDSYI